VSTAVELRFTSPYGPLWDLDDARLEAFVAWLSRTAQIWAMAHRRAPPAAQVRGPPTAVRLPALTVGEVGEP